VGITRAERRLYLTYADRRMLHGETRDCIPSRFLREIPKELIDESDTKKKRTVNEQNYYKERQQWDNKPSLNMGSIFADQPQKTVQTKEGQSYSLHMKVQHKSFGEGMIMKIKGSGKDAILEIAFEGKGIKELSAAYAPLEIL
jgi:DNA helicase-2/ATP-dependent DNA helicase PcrA